MSGFFSLHKGTFRENPFKSNAARGTRLAESRRGRIASGLIATLFGAALYLGAGAAQAQVITTFADACSGQAPGTQVTIGPFYTGDTTQGASNWTASPIPTTAGYFVSGWANIASATPVQPTGANWLGMNGSTGASYTFTLDQSIVVDSSIIDPSSIGVTGFFSADNYVTSIQVGTNSITPPSSISFTSLGNLATAAPGLGSLFEVGNNTLSFVVFNSGTTPSTTNPTGLYANVSINATCVAQPAIAITKTVVTPTDPTAALQPNDPVAYTVTVSNTSATAAAAAVLVSDPVPTGIDASTVTWSCNPAQATGGAACPAAPDDSGTGDLSSTIAALPPGGSLTYRIDGNAVASVSGPVTNTATASGAALVCADGGALPCPASKSIPEAEADLRGSGTSVGATVGTPVTATLTCANSGPNDAVNATCLIDPATVPADATITCTQASTNATLPQPVQVPLLPVDDSIVCTVDFTPTSTAPVTLTATAGSDTPDPNRANNPAKATVNPVAPLRAPAATSVPTLTDIALILLTLLLGASALAVHRRGR